MVITECLKFGCSDIYGMCSSVSRGLYPSSNVDDVCFSFDVASSSSFATLLRPAACPSHWAFVRQLYGKSPSGSVAFSGSSPVNA